ncbi:uncharacterized protein LOC126751177 [Bactrocera neohumeralis]|uniref:uncharacterized protein LOC120766198 n=1 Tax=Bactrocera tryoni TaxID=59916 RepID=UPI001A965400|nr:uncharacterized protein LOC120766198 [Bactrocera tryoni]XP_050317184.1 uncharacterized protein LOC126751177 [Bactrocera neohumeralis]
MSFKSNWDTKSINHYRTVQRIKKQLRQGNSAYLCNHPEIRAIIRVLIHEAINEKTENFPQFIANLFSCANTPRLIIMINEQMKVVNKELKKSRYTGFDPEMILEERESTHSLISKTSIPDSANAILKYALILPSNGK